MSTGTVRYNKGYREVSRTKLEGTTRVPSGGDARCIGPPPGGPNSVLITSFSFILKAFLNLLFLNSFFEF